MTNQMCGLCGREVHGLCWWEFCDKCTTAYCAAKHHHEHEAWAARVRDLREKLTAERIAANDSEPFVRELHTWCVIGGPVDERK